MQGVFWLADAPDVSNLHNLPEQENEHILSYFDKLISAVNPNPDCKRSEEHPSRKRFREVHDYDEDVAQLLRTVQRHTKCSKDYCLRQNKRTKTIECRFQFPKDETDHCAFKLSDSNTSEFCPKRNDKWLNKYNRFILQLWRANIDVSPVLSKEALMMYLAKYISKSERQSQAFESLFSSLLDTTDDGQSCKKLLQRYFMKTCGERDFSAQEVCRILLGRKLYSSGGRKFTTIYLSIKDEWVPVMDDTLKADSSCDVNHPGARGFVKKYLTRPADKEALTLWSTAKFYDPVTWKTHKKPSIVRFFPRYKLTDDEKLNENFYRQMVLLHFPWRENYAEDTSWKQLYTELDISPNSGLQCPLANIEDVVEDELQREKEEELEEENLDYVRGEEWMVAAQLGPHRGIPEIELGRCDIDLGFPWSSTYKNYKDYGTLQDLQDFIPSQKAGKVPVYHDSPEVQNITFNAEQSMVLDLLKLQLANGSGTAEPGSKLNLFRIF